MRPKEWLRSLRGRVLALPLGAVSQASDAMLRLAAAISGKTRNIETLRIDRRQVRRLEERLNTMEHREKTGHPAEGLERLVEAIRLRSLQENRNNITRTAAYLAYFLRRPEVHWAFLAHMVSRNGGWNMTDLQGESLPKLLGRAAREKLFAALETANAAIFGDAYPQLLLYEESVRCGKPLFFLLPCFRVSAFMQAVWEIFWEERSSELLTMGLIVNEQHVAERQVVAHGRVQRETLGSLAFHVQAALQLNQVILPFASETGEIRLAGGAMENFNNVKERIEFGKTLYAALWGIPEVSRGAMSFAQSTPHTASRSDYWPEQFTAEGNAALPGAPRRLYSPHLEDAWPDFPLPEQPPQDWFRNAKEACRYLTDVKPPFPYEMSGKHLYWLKTIQLAASAAALVK